VTPVPKTDSTGRRKQYGVDNIRWRDFVVTRAGLDGVTVETACHNATIRDFSVISAGSIGVNVTSGDVAARNSDVVIEDGVVHTSATGYSFGLTDRVAINRCNSFNATTRDLYVAETTGFSRGLDNFTNVAYGTNVTHRTPQKVPLSFVNSWRRLPARSRPGRSRQATEWLWIPGR
jgi:hypothetical protein